MKPLLTPAGRAVARTAMAVGLIGTGFIAGCVVAGQPHMINALNALRTAKGELEVAEHNKGGHRLAALERVEEAIRQVRLGIEAGGG